MNVVSHQRSTFAAATARKETPANRASCTGATLLQEKQMVLAPRSLVVIGRLRYYRVDGVLLGFILIKLRACRAQRTLPGSSSQVLQWDRLTFAAGSIVMVEATDGRMPWRNSSHIYPPTATSLG